MKWTSQLGWAIAALLSGLVLHGCMLSATQSPRLESVAIASPTPVPTLEHQVHELPNSTVYTLRIPAGERWVITPAVAEMGQRVDEFAQAAGAIAALNAGFFDPMNQQTTSHIVIAGQVAADPAQNERLVGNPDLIPVMPQILNRSEFRRYSCDGVIRYDITFHDAPIPATCELVDAIGAGPQLLPELTAETEAFVNQATGRDALGSDRPNARTAIGITASGDVLWVMATQRPDVNPSGMTFAQMIDFLRSHGVERALNLDGGSSSSLYYDGTVYFGRLGAEGNRVMRPVKSVLLLHDLEQ